VSDGVDNLEVALQGDHHKTDLFDDQLTRTDCVEVTYIIHTAEYDDKFVLQ